MSELTLGLGPGRTPPEGTPRTWLPASGEEQRHHQRRLATCFGALGAIKGVFLLTFVAAVVIVDAVDMLASRSRLIDVAMIGLLAAGWAACRCGERGRGGLAAIELGVTAGAMTLTAVPVALEASFLRPDLGASAMFLLLLSLRAGLLPGAPRWSLLVSSVSAAPLVIGAMVRPALAPDRSVIPGWATVVSVLVWCLAGVAAAVVVARTIHGLRAEVVSARRLGQYTLEEKIGEGGMGVVYRARHAMLRRPAAIKLLRPGRADEAELARFEREAQLTSQLAHPSTVSVFDYGRTADGGFYYVMEYLDGFDLERLVRLHGPLSPPLVIRVLAQVCGALSEAHLRGLVHRDIKPANLILTERADEPDVVKVVDFGLVRVQSQEAPGSPEPFLSAIIGTPSYLAPEAILSPRSADARSDLYALGAVGYFLLTGQPVFRAPTVVDLCLKHLAEPPAPPSRRRGQPVPADLESVLLACLEKDPDRRPATAEALRASLLACADAGRYDAVAARRWWSEHRPCPSREAPSPPSAPLELRVRRSTA